MFLISDIPYIHWNIIQEVRTRISKLFLLSGCSLYREHGRPEEGGGARGGGGRGAHLDQDVCKNLGLLWQVDCLLFVLSRSSSIFINELYIIISLLLIESRYFVSVKTSGRNQTAQFLPPSGSVKISCRNQTA